MMRSGWPGISVPVKSCGDSLWNGVARLIDALVPAVVTATMPVVPLVAVAVSKVRYSSITAALMLRA